MKLNYFLTIILIFGFALSSEGLNILECINGNWQKCGFQIAVEVFKLHRWSGSSFDLCGYRCDYAIKGRFRKLKWVWDGKINCNGLGSGEKRGKGSASRKGAIDGALQDLFSKLSPEQLMSLANCLPNN